MTGTPTSGDAAPSPDPAEPQPVPTGVATPAPDVDDAQARPEPDVDAGPDADLAAPPRPAPDARSEPDVDAEPDAAPARPASARPASRRRPRRPVLVVGLVVVGLLVVVTGWVGLRAYQAERALTGARATASALEKSLLSGTGDAATRRHELADAQRATRTAVHATSDPVWRAVQTLPWVGPQLRAVATVSSSLDTVTHDALPPALALVATVQDGSVRRADGTFDLAAIASAATGVDAADTAAARASADVAGIDTGALLGRLAEPVRQAQRELASFASTVHTARTVVDLAPGMLGTGGARTYLVLALNNAELRASGGIVGSVIGLHVADGKLSLGTQVASSELPHLVQPVLPLTAEELGLDDARFGTYVQNATLTPDFPRTAQLVVARWEQVVGGPVDGVVGVDAVAVGEMLAATGPITTAEGLTLTSHTFVDEVLRKPYLDVTDAKAASVASDKVFGQVASAIFGALGSHDVHPSALLSALRTVTGEQRLHLWSAHADEQKVLVGTTAGGAFLTGPFATAAGVFLEDGSAGKLDYYLHSTLSVVARSCASAGQAGTVTLRLTLSYHPPADVATSSILLQGLGVPGVPAGYVSTSIRIFAPRGQTVGQVLLGGQAVGGRSVQQGGRQVLALPSVLAPGGTATYQITLPLHGDDLPIWTTPTRFQGGLIGAACTAD